MNKIYNILMLLAIALTGLSLTACSEDELDTNQYKGGVSLNVYGPQPVMRGGYLRFLGSNLDQIAQIQIPGCDPITNYEVKKSGVPSEIWVQVPEEAEPGVVTLVTKTDQKITTKTALTFSEPIKITKFSPTEVMPGEQITIEGEYLELIQMVQFANANDKNVYVGQDAFTEHTRYKITLTVPEEASTGKLNLYTLDLTNEENDPDDMTYNILETEDALTVGTPTVSKLKGREEVDAQGTITAKMGETITITGEHFGLVSSVTFGDNAEDIIEQSESSLTISKDGKTISLKLSGLEPDGSINLVTRSGVSVPVGQLVTVAPTNCAATPSPVKAGQPLTITGNDLDVVYQVIFLDKDGNEIAVSENGSDNKFTCSEDGSKLVIDAVPETAVDGKLILRMWNDKDTDVAFTLVKPIVSGYNSASVSAGGALELKGTDLDLVSSIDFGGAAVPSADFASQSETSITLTVPMEAKSGAPTLTLKNGTTVEAPELTISEAVFCYATVLPSAEDEIKAGTSVTLTVKNMDKLTGVEIDGETCQFVKSGDETLIIGIPQTAGAGSSVKLISSNGEVTYTVDFVPATEVNKVIWSGMTELQWAEGGRVCLPASAFENVPAGAILTLCYTQINGEWGAFQINYPSEGWPGVNFTEGDIKVNQQLVPTDIYGWFSDGILNRETSLVLTQDILDNILANRSDYKGKTESSKDVGIIMQGQKLIVTKVTLSYTIASELNITGNCVHESATTSQIEFPWNFGWGSDGALRIQKTGSVDLTSKKWTAGKSVIRFYKPAANKGQIQICKPVDGWGTFTTVADWNGDQEVLEYTFTQEMCDYFNGTTLGEDASTAIICQGDLAGVTKITVEP